VAAPAGSVVASLAWSSDSSVLAMLLRTSQDSRLQVWRYGDGIVRSGQPANDTWSENVLVLRVSLGAVPALKCL